MNKFSYFFQIIVLELKFLKIWYYDLKDKYKALIKENKKIKRGV